MSFIRSAISVRNLMTSAARQGSHGGVPGENLPFSIHNKYKLLAMFMAFFGSGFSAPFLIVRYQLLKK